MRNYVIFLSVILVLTAISVLNANYIAAPVQENFGTNSALESVRYQIDAAQSKFMVKASRGGIAWFKGRNHLLAVREFSGEADVSLNVINPASLQMTIRADSLEETSDEFTAEQKKIINKELDEIVLESAKYPEITFKSTDVKGKFVSGAFEAEIGGDMTLHGVTRRVTIPAKVTVSGENLLATGSFEINRKKFGVNATNAFHGFVRVKHGLKFTFDIVAHRIS
ncbi:MAG TPA: YceI family protein [Pyrinomonadaceae bacterium]|jgi:polyisoprenoid-binding protein YceI